MMNINSKNYWKLKNFSRKISFEIRKMLFQIRNKFRNFVDELGIEGSLFKYLFKDAIKAFVVVAIIISIEKIVYAQYAIYQSNPLVKTIGAIFSFDYSTFVDFVIAIVSVVGIFLGLYFATITNILASTYSNLPREVRRLFENEKLGNKYIRALVQYILICLIVLCLNIIGIKTLNVVTIFITIFGVKAILSFLILGKRLFMFSDVFSITSSIYPEITRNIKMASIEGYAYTDVSFQSHYHSSCKKQIELLREIATAGILYSKSKNNSVMQFLNDNLSILLFYTKNKCGIPFNSKWYDEKYSFDSWFTAIDISVALNTGTSLKPKAIIDRSWFETSLIQINEMLLDNAIETKNIELVNNYTNIWVNLNRKLIANLETDIYSKSYLKIQNKLHEHIIKHSNFSLEDCLSNRDDSISTIELLSCSYINLILGIQDNVHKLSDERLNELVNNAIWSDVNSISKFDLPFKSFEIIEDLKEKLIFEEQIEKKIISPKWYIKQLISLKFLTIIDEIILLIKDLLNKQFLEVSMRYSENKKYVHAFEVISSGIECWHKADNLLRTLEVIYIRLNENKVEKNIPWVLINFTDVFTDTRIIYKKLIDEIAENIIHLMPYNRSNSFPDIFGFAYNYISEAVFSSIITLDDEHFMKLYERYIKICFLMEDKVRAELEDSNNVQFKLLMPINCIIDFMAISGHAIYISELTGNDSMKTIVMSNCDNFFNRLTDMEMVLEKLVLMHRADRDLFNIYQRSVIRTNWKQRFEHAIINKKLIEKENLNAFPFVERIKHDNPLIDCFYFSFDHGFMNDFEEVFLELYVNSRIKDTKKRFISGRGWTERYNKKLNKDRD